MSAAQSRASNKQGRQRIRHTRKVQEATCDIQESEVLAQMPRNQEEEGLSDAQHPGIRVGEFVTQTDTSITRDVLQPKNKTERE